MPQRATHPRMAMVEAAPPEGFTWATFDDAAAVTPSATKLYCLNVQLCIKPERRDEFLECIKANRAGTLSNEPLAVTYLFGEDEKTPNTFHFFEQYEGRAGFEAHTKTPHFADWEVFAQSDPFTSDPIVSFYVEHNPGRNGPALASVDPSKKTMFCLHVALHVKPDVRAEFLEAMKGDQAGALDTEAACANYLFGEDENAPNTFHMFERYVDRAGFEAHAQSAHYKKWSEFKLTEPFSAPAKVSYYNTVL